MKHVAAPKIYSPKNHRLGRLLFVASVFLTPLFTYVVYAMEHEESPHSAIVFKVGVAIGLLAIALGFRKERLVITSDSVSFKPWLFAKPVRYAIPAEAGIALRSRENELHKIFWRAAIAQGDNEQVLVERENAQFEMRNTVEAICKASGRPMLDESEPNRPVEMAAADLDLPLAERLEKYAALRQRKVKMPRLSGIEEEVLPNGDRRFSWYLATRRLVGWLAAITVMFIALYFVPGETSHSFYDQYGWDGFLPYVEWVVLIGGAFIVLGLGGQERVTFDSGHIAVSYNAFGLPIWRSTLPASEIEDIRTLGSPSVKIISDRKIITARTFHFTDLDRGCARWLAYELQRTLRWRLQTSGGEPEEEAREGVES
ncbi:MAG: hypothetical protein FJX76_02585 [Armatimonadetes bacterium]|nr:hypothetical protein [Armatimonadota bacterium]